MDPQFPSLPIHELGEDAGFRRPTQPAAARVTLADVEGARVGHILETLTKSGRQHALVVEYEVVPPKTVLDHPAKRTLVRGIFSLSQLARQLGLTLQSSGEVARAFAEIEAALSR